MKNLMVLLFLLMSSSMAFSSTVYFKCFPENENRVPGWEMEFKVSGDVSEAAIYRGDFWNKLNLNQSDSSKLIKSFRRIYYNPLQSMARYDSNIKLDLKNSKSYFYHTPKIKVQFQCLKAQSHELHLL